MSVTIHPYIATPYDINVNTLVNGGSTGAWVLGSPTITHNNSIGSKASKVISSLVIGKSYRITYTISSYTNCNVQVFLGDTAGTARTSSGTFVETLVCTGSKKIKFYSSGTATISHYKIEELVDTIDDTPIDITDMENKSWTLSYNPILNQWISFHSYLPNNYITKEDGLITKRNDSQLKDMNKGDYGKFFDEDVKPFIIESIFNELKLETKVFDSVTVIMESNNDGVYNNVFFDKGIVYTENQCSGEIVFDIGNNVTRKEKNWNFNKFLDITKSTHQKIFVSDWDSTKLVYPIDKVINVNKIDTAKPWYQRGRMRDKYLAVRFISSNLDISKLICKFVVSSFRVSKR